MARPQANWAHIVVWLTVFYCILRKWPLFANSEMFNAESFT